MKNKLVFGGSVGIIVTTAVLLSEDTKHQTSKELLLNVVIILADDLGYGDLGCFGAIGREGGQRVLVL